MTLSLGRSDDAITALWQAQKGAIILSSRLDGKISGIEPCFETVGSALPRGLGQVATDLLSEFQFLLEVMSDGWFEVEMWRVDTFKSFPIDAHIVELYVPKEFVGCAVTVPFVEQHLVVEWSVVFLE